MNELINLFIYYIYNLLMINTTNQRSEWKECRPWCGSL